MPYRNDIISQGEIYHVFNRSVARQSIFTTLRDYKRGLNLIKYYQFFRPPLRFSHFNRLPVNKRSNFLLQLEKTGIKNIEILAFCLMPNHFHFLLKELATNGITTFMRNYQNSYAKYFNTKYDRTGSVFQSMFKTVRIETDDQLTHITRYIHLNPYTSFMVKNLSELEHYSFSSYPTYLGNNIYPFVNTKKVLQFFPNIEEFKKFTVDQADYQRKLDHIYHLTLD